MKDKSTPIRLGTAEVPPRIVSYFDENWDNLKTSLLTKSTREYLLGRDEFKGENAKQKENQKRMRIRERVKQGLIDFSLINRMGQKDISLIFSDLESDSIFFLSLIDLLSFVHQGIKESPVRFEEALGRAILISERRSSSKPGKNIVEVNIDIDATYEDRPNDEAVLERLLDGKSISREEFAKLVIAKKELFSPQVLSHIEETNERVHVEKGSLDEIKEAIRSETS